MAPIGASIERPVCSAQASAPSATESASTPQSGCIARSRLPRFHGRAAKSGRIAASATMNGVKARSKNGGPTETLRPVTTSATSGHIVPKKTTKVATTRRRLLRTRPLSRLIVAKAVVERSIGARQA